MKVPKCQTVMQNYRYQLPKKSIKSDCPACGPKHRRTLSRYVDTGTGEPLPDEYGKCDRESNCGYHLSPYHKSATGLTYADQVYEQDRQQKIDVRPIRSKLVQTSSPSVIDTRCIPASVPDSVISIPDDLFQKSLGRYDQNKFATLLGRHFGIDLASKLLKRFQIGTSSRWPGACIFWYIDEKGRKRGGQIKLFNDDWHTVKYFDQQRQKRSKTSWVHTSLLRRLSQLQQPIPEWLSEYMEKAECSPCLFGLPQLLTASPDYPVAIVEAPKTAILSTAYFPEYIWLAAGALTYLNSGESGLQRLAPVRARPITLFPDLSKDDTAFARWSRIASELNQIGFQINVSRLLEEEANDKQREAGEDLADWILAKWKEYPPDWDTSIR